jgi:hypothetical protein
MIAKGHSRGRRLPFICAECGDELMLSPSGHYFCANRLCKDGFDIRPDWRLTTVFKLLPDEKKLQ